MSDALHCCTSFIVVACHGSAGSVAIIPSLQYTEVHEASRAKVTPKKVGSERDTNLWRAQKQSRQWTVGEREKKEQHQNGQGDILAEER